jgi:hypothetical protein
MQYYVKRVSSNPSNCKESWMEYLSDESAILATKATAETLKMYQHESESSEVQVIKDGVLLASFPV